MKIPMTSKIFEGAYTISPMNGAAMMPWVQFGSRTEYLCCRTSAWLGVNLCMSPVFDIKGPDAAKFLNQTCVNPNFDKMKTGQSKHGIICNEQGHMLADGVIMKKDDCYRTYWLAPCIQYFMFASGLDVQGEYVDDEYFYQIDGPKSLEILEEACECNLHDIKFAKNKTVTCCGHEMTVHRLGMSGALAYEVHGSADTAEEVYCKLLEVTKKYGGMPLGSYNYSILNHTPGGYPNQLQHYPYALLTSGEQLADFAKKYCMLFPLRGSAMNDPLYCEVTPYDVGWGNRINFNHDFMGKEALMKIKEERNFKKAVTLEWNTEDVGDVFMSQFRGQDEEPYDQIDCISALDSYETFGIHCDYVEKDGEKIGFASGRTYAFYERRMISLAFIDPKYAEEGTEVEVIWGEPGHRVKRIRATVARFPYYNGEYRNETCDVDALIPKRYE